MFLCMDFFKILWFYNIYILFSEFSEQKNPPTVCLGNVSMSQTSLFIKKKKKRKKILWSFFEEEKFLENSTHHIQMQQTIIF